jgi:hypothetical protein
LQLSQNEFFPEYIHVKHECEHVIAARADIRPKIKQQKFGNFDGFAVGLRFAGGGNPVKMGGVYPKAVHFREIEFQPSDGIPEQGTVGDLIDQTGKRAMVY